MNKKTKIAIIAVIALVLVTVGITYAYWLITRTQEGTNVITTGCLDIALNGENDITLTNQFPISDEDGMNLTPYTFTVTNNCNTSLYYEVTLDALETDGDEINANAIKFAFTNDEITDIANLGRKPVVDSSIEGVYESRKLTAGTLAPRENADGEDSVTYNLRLWLAEDASISEMNKTFKSKISVTAGQGIESYIKQGTLAYDIVESYEGIENITEISAIWTETAEIDYDYSYISKTSSYWYGTEYKFDNKTGNYSLSGNLVQATVEECRNGTKSCGMYTIKDTEKNAVSRYLTVISSFTNSSQSDTSNNYYITSTRKESRNGFSEEIAGLYSTQDDLGTSYYFRGDVEDNYVKFGTYKKAGNFEAYDGYEAEVDVGTPMYWRIVRINGDGTIRLAYDGITPVETDEVHGASVGMVEINMDTTEQQSYYSYPIQNGNIDSDLKTAADDWYANYLTDSYKEYIADGIFCNDKEPYYHTDLAHYYKSNQRLMYNGENNPTLKCNRPLDAYSVNTNIGNGQLQYPVGLLTADEVFMAGQNDSSYLQSATLYWTMTPIGYGDDYDTFGAGYFFAGSGWGLTSFHDTYWFAIRPVINIKADVQFTGSGTVDSPYEIVME